jgi:tetratricopeptide (TPR) repeat protein
VLPHVERLPEQERDRRFFEVLNQQGTALFYLGQFREVLNRLRPHEAQLNRLSDPSIATDYNFLLTMTSSFLGDRQGAPRYGQRALEEAEQGGLRVAVGKAHLALTNEHYFSGRIREAIAHGQKAVAILDQTAEQALLATAYSYLSGAYLFASELDLAIDSATRSCEIGQMIGDRRVQTQAGVVCSFAYTWRGAWDKAIEAGERALELSPDPFETALALGAVGVAYLERGNVEKALDILERAVAEAARFRSRQIQASWKTYLAEAYFLVGRLGDARTLVLEALEISRDTGYALGVGGALRVLGRLAQAAGNFGEAQAHLDQAVETFASVNARYVIARTHLDSASLANARGDRDATKKSLQSAYVVFVALNAPNLVARTEQLAVEYGIKLHDLP